MVPKSLSVDVVYLITILADHPRSIDRYIDYFGRGGGPRSPQRRGTLARSSKGWAPARARVPTTDARA